MKGFSKRESVHAKRSDLSNAGDTVFVAPHTRPVKTPRPVTPADLLAAMKRAKK
jgi:hypothetical protein